jgi:hypothetical protein
LTHNKQWTIRAERFTIWDIVNTLDIEHLVTAIRQLSTGASSFKELNEPVEIEVIEAIGQALWKCERPFMDMGMKISSRMINKFLSAASLAVFPPVWTGLQFSERCLAVFSAIQCETMGVFCIKIGDQNTAYLDKPLPFGQAVATALSECSEDIEEAHQCIAFERYTASMFHIGRAMELAVKRVAKKMGVQAHRDEWQSYLNAMNDKIDKMPFKTSKDKSKRALWAEMAAHLFNFKEAWRNPTFHAKKTYTPSEAFSALSNAGIFMDYIARRLFNVKVV